jgi:dynein heavy chain
MFISLNVNDINNFEIKRITKFYYIDEEVKIKSFETQIQYGYEYLGVVKRLVLTNLTERMQLIYMSAIQYSLGGAAVGPAGTGKSETTKDIARMIGKACLIYNCS